MGIRVDQNILNQKGTPAFNAAPFSARPTAGFLGRIFISTDTYEIYRDESVGWSLIADAGAGSGTLESVTFNGNNTPYGINITNGGLFLLGSTNGSIFFAAGGSGQFTTDSTNFFWDDTNNRLGIGTAAPSAKLDVHSSSGTSAILNGTGVSNALLTFQSAGVNKWSVGNFVSSTVANDFNIYDNVNTVSRLQVHNTGVVNIPTTLIIGTTTPTSTFALDVTGSGKFTGQLSLTSNNVSSSTTTGALVITGGIGIGGALFGTNGTFSQDIASLAGQIASVKNGSNTQGSGAYFLLSNAASNQLWYQQLNASNGLDYWYNGSVKINITSGGQFTINTPSSGVGLLANGRANEWTIQATASSTSGQSFGLKVQAGTTTGDTAFLVQNQAGSTDYLKVRGGDGIIITNAGVYNNTSVSAANMIIYAGYDLGRTISSARYKTQIEDIEKSFIDNIYKMKPRYYRSLCERDKKDWSHFGFIAEEMAEIEPRFVHFKEDEEGNQIAEGVQYDRITALLTAAIQELNEKLIRNNIN